MNTTNYRTTDELRYDLACKIAALDEKGMEIFLTLLKEREPDLFRELFPKGGKQHDAT